MLVKKIKKYCLTSGSEIKEEVFSNMKSRHWGERMESVNYSVVLRVLKEEGLSGAWMRIKQKVVVTSDMYQIDLNAMHLKMDEGEPKDFLLMPMTQALYQRMVEVHGTEISPDKKKLLWERLAENSTDRAYLLLEKEVEILGFYCISYGDNVDVEKNYVVEEVKGNAYLFDAYTFIPHRKRGAQKYATIERLKMLKQRGFETATVMVDSRNQYSKKAMLTCGFRKIGEVTHVNLRIWKGNIESCCMG